MKRSATSMPPSRKQRTDQCLDDIADDILALAGPVLPRLLAEPDQRRNADLTAILGAGFAVDQAIVAFGKVAFGLVGIAFVQRPGDDHAEHPVAEELEPLIAFAADARVRESELEQVQVTWLVPELIPDEGGNVRLHSATPV